MKKLYGTAGA